MSYIFSFSLRTVAFIFLKFSSLCLASDSSKSLLPVSPFDLCLSHRRLSFHVLGFSVLCWKLWALGRGLLAVSFTKYCRFGLWGREIHNASGFACFLSDQSDSMLEISQSPFDCWFSEWRMQARGALVVCACGHLIPSPENPSLLWGEGGAAACCTQ